MNNDEIRDEICLLAQMAEDFAIAAANMADTLEAVTLDDSDENIARALRARQEFDRIAKLDEKYLARFLLH